MNGSSNFFKDSVRLKTKMKGVLFCDNLVGEFGIFENSQMNLCSAFGGWISNVF